MSLCLIIDYVTYLCLKEIFFRPRHIFFTYPVSRSVAGRALGKLVLNLELDMVNRLLKLCLSIQSATQSGANIYLYKTLDVTCTQQNSFLDNLRQHCQQIEVIETTLIEVIVFWSTVSLGPLLTNRSQWPPLHRCRRWPG